MWRIVWKCAICILKTNDKNLYALLTFLLIRTKHWIMMFKPFDHINSISIGLANVIMLAHCLHSFTELLVWRSCLNSQTLVQNRHWVQDNKNNNKRSIKQWETLTASHSSYSKFPQCEHRRQPEDNRASVSLLLKATSQHSRLQQAQIWQPTGNSCHSRARSIRALSQRLAPSLAALSLTPVGRCTEMQLMPTSKISRWKAALCPWLLRAEG